MQNKILFQWSYTRISKHWPNRSSLHKLASFLLEADHLRLICGVKELTSKHILHNPIINHEHFQTLNSDVQKLLFAKLKKSSALFLHSPPPSNPPIKFLPLLTSARQSNKLSSYHRRSTIATHLQIPLQIPSFEILSCMPKPHHPEHRICNRM